MLQLTDVSKRFQDGARVLTVLDCACLDVSNGELVGIYGERRSGKSTLLRLAAGLEAPDGGSVHFDGKDVTAMSVSGRARLRRRGGIALASGDCQPIAGGQPVIEHVALPLTNDGLTLGESEALAQAVLDQAGIGSLSHQLTDRLSISDRVRVELARALVREPQLLLVDEPAVLPGPSEGRELLRLLHSLAGSSRIAVIIASQDMTALAGVERFLSLSDGRLRSTDSRRRVIEFPGGGRRQQRAS